MGSFPMGQLNKLLRRRLLQKWRRNKSRIAAARSATIAPGAAAESLLSSMLLLPVLFAHNLGGGWLRLSVLLLYYRRGSEFINTNHGFIVIACP
jgi:hypothetical protein